MAILDIKQAVDYGANSMWASKFFSSYNDNQRSNSNAFTFGDVQVDYTDSCASRNTWGQCRSGTAQRDVPRLYSASSSFEFARQTITGQQFAGNSIEINASLNDAIRNSSDQQPLQAKGPIISSPNRKNDTTRTPFPIHLTQRADASKATFITDNTNVAISNGNITLSAMEAAQGGSSSLSFRFIPGQNPVARLSHSTTDTISAVTTNGTTNSSSNTQTANASIKNSVTLGVRIGIGDESSDDASVGISNTTSVDMGWRGAWTNLSSYNFSERSTTSTTTSENITVNLDLNRAKANSDGMYDFTTQISQPNGADSIAQGVKFIPGKRYQASITFVRTNIENVISGTYDIAGTIGTLQDSSDNALSLTAAQAVNEANNRRGASILNYDRSSLGNLNPTQDRIGFEGSASAGTRVNTSFSVMFTELGEASDALVSAPGQSSLALQNQSVSSGSEESIFSRDYDLSRLDSSAADGMGVSMVTETLENERTMVTGTGSADYVVASDDGSHHFEDFKSSLIRGNHQADTLLLIDEMSDNTLHLMQGDDYVIAHERQTARLGKGNDRYTINGGKGHNIRLGEGRDSVVVNSVNDVYFVISDFEFDQDTIILGSSLDPSKFQATRVEMVEGNEWTSRLEFTYDGDAIGAAYIHDIDRDSVTLMSEQGSMVELAFLNASRLDLAEFAMRIAGDNSMSSHQMLDHLILKNNLWLDDPLINHDDWQMMDLDQRSQLVADAMQDLGSTTTQEEWLSLFEGSYQDYGPELDDFSMDLISNLMIVDQTEAMKL